MSEPHQLSTATAAETIIEQPVVTAGHTSTTTAQGAGYKATTPPAPTGKRATWTAAVSADLNNRLTLIYTSHQEGDQPFESKSAFLGHIIALGVGVLDGIYIPIETAAAEPIAPECPPAPVCPEPVYVIDAAQDEMLRMLFARLQPVIDGRVAAGVTRDPAHLVIQMADFACNYNRIGSKYSKLVFAVPSDFQLQVEGGFWPKQ